MDAAPTTTEANKDVVRRFDDLFGSSDLTELDELATPDLVNHALAPNRPNGLEGTRQFLAGVGQNFVEDRWQQLDVIAEGPFVVQHGIRGGRWGGGQFLGFDAPAGDYAREVAFIYRLSGGRIAERWAVRDDLTMLRQLGALPPAGVLPLGR
jgi:predicted ester cyclase